MFLCLVACTKPTQVSITNQMFENAVRRDATTDEAGYVVKVDTGCTAFFVKNSGSETLMISARHCTQDKEQEWCANGGSFENDITGIKGTCKSILASDATHDVFMFSANVNKAPTQTLSLAANAPKVKDALKMIGYPADQNSGSHVGRFGKLTVTENCWVLGANYESPYIGSEYVYRDIAALHNCSVYGGNSGGPMILEKTEVALGLPFTYSDDLQERSSSDLQTASNMAQMSDFVATFRTILDNYKVSLATTAIDPPTEAPGTNPTNEGGNSNQKPPYYYYLGCFVNGGHSSLLSDFYLVVDTANSPYNYYLWDGTQYLDNLKNISDSDVHVDFDLDASHYHVDYTNLTSTVTSGNSTAFYLCSWQ